MAATALVGNSKGYRARRHWALLVVAAAEATPESSTNPYPLGAAVGLIDARATGLQGRIEKLLRGATPYAVKRGLVYTLLQNDRENWLAVLLRIMREQPPDRIIITEALDLGEMTAEQREQSCKALVAVIGDKDSRAHDLNKISQRLIASCGSAGRTAALDAMEARAKAGTLGGIVGLRRMFDGNGVTAQDKRRALAIARLVADNDDLPRASRKTAMGILVGNDAAGKAHVEELASGAPSLVRELAQIALGTAARERVLFSGSGGRATINKMWQQVDAARACYQTALKKAPKLFGSTIIKYDVDSSGRISKAVGFGSLPDATKRCVAKAIKKVKLQKSSTPLKGKVVVMFMLRN